MISLKFTAEELAEMAEMARADAEIEETFVLTAEDVLLSRELDKQSGTTSKRNKQEYMRDWYAINKAKILAKRREHYQRRKDYYQSYHTEYCKTHASEIAAQNRKYYERHAAEIAEKRHRRDDAAKGVDTPGKRAIRELRATLAMSQAQFGLLLGVTQACICRWENVRAPENWEEIIAPHLPKP